MSYQETASVTVVDKGDPGPVEKLVASALGPRHILAK